MKIETFIKRHPLACYFGAAFIISWGSGLVLLVPKLVRGEAIQAAEELFLFPVLVLGVGLTAMILTGIVEGRSGVRNLFSRMGRWHIGARWYAALLIPPVLILLVLLSFSLWVAPVFAPNFFPLGILFGLFPGFVEEIGWTGYAFPKMQSRYDALPAGVILGVLWGLWHLPVVDYLGAAAPHGAYWLPFFLTFIVLVTALRVLIVWVYSNTQSLLLAQLMHASSTAFLVILSPVHTSPAQETLWYAVYAGILWIAIAIVSIRYGKSLTRGLPRDKAT